VHIQKSAETSRNERAFQLRRDSLVGSGVTDENMRHGHPRGTSGKIYTTNATAQAEEQRHSARSVLRSLNNLEGIKADVLPAGDGEPWTDGMPEVFRQAGAAGPSLTACLSSPAPMLLL